MEEQAKAVTISWPARNHSITLNIRPTDSSHVIHERIRLLMNINQHVPGPWFLTDLLGCNVAAIHYDTLMNGERLTVNVPGTNPPAAAKPSPQALLSPARKRKADDEGTARGGSYSRATLVTSTKETGSDETAAVDSPQEMLVTSPRETGYDDAMAVVNAYHQALWVPPINETDNIETANNETPAMNPSIQELLSRRAMDIVNKQKAAANPPASSQMLPPPIPPTQQKPDDEETDSAESDVDLAPAHKTDYLWRVHRRLKNFGDELSALDVAKSATQFNEHLIKGFDNVLVNIRGRYIPDKISPFPHAVIRSLDKLWENSGWLVSHVYSIVHVDRPRVLFRVSMLYCPIPRRPPHRPLPPPPPLCPLYPHPIPLPHHRHAEQTLASRRHVPCPRTLLPRHPQQLGEEAHRTVQSSGHRCAAYQDTA
ncbi:hypothetical protein BCR34DRAFT_393125 [Clohesyomyces aquaticus]|uniref:Uncharacterized protein n=1 Tax=Clohesyomyces aquaticus TaxID=1231657 RepID=A0A1Y1ZE45_9PLEO|nr:hypothetical protein BCR34DRAFT_393125 [Clohesyomyces aquaticus]